MKETTLQTLITARALLEQAERQCGLGDRYLATAGLIVLQDAVELVFLAVLIEKQLDEKRAIEKLTFDEMISALGQLGMKVPKSGTLKAMNKLRVTAKHYGQVMEPLTVQGHLIAAKVAIDAVLNSAVGKPLREIFLVEVVGNTISRPFLDDAVSALAESDYAKALIATRKAFFLEFENDYCIYPYRNITANSPIPGGLLGLGLLGTGRKAPYWTRNADWIRDNVETPFDYVQINYETWRIDAMEWGINTQILNNIRRLTPEAIRLEIKGEWYIRLPAAYAANSSNHENASGCLDLTIEAIRRKHEHIRAARIASEDKPYETPDAYVGQPLFERPARDSKVIRALESDDTYVVREMLSGFNPSELFYRIKCTPESGEPVWGYVERIKAQPLDEPDPDIQMPEADNLSTPLDNPSQDSK
ncbi:hypothetical protein BconGalA64_44460 [Burkholderia contaminans]|uniref:hypothetical protein n=1 Tax=Burkholderia contaminans TaxID=488447 RepID=UPI00308ED1B1|nr:hypothetical protein BconGalA64_44460 [Burkholderia contaminans]